MEEIPTRKPLSAFVSPELLSAIVDTTGALVVVLDRDGRIVLFNRACERLTGYSFDEVRGTYVWDRLLVPEEIDAVKGVFQELAEGNFPNEHENAWVTRDGHKRWIRWSNTALVADGGDCAYVIGTGIDITEHQRAEQSQEELYRRNQAILDTAVDGIITIDERGIIESFNRSAERIFGYTAAKVIGRNVSVLMPAPYRDEHDRYVRHYLDTGEKRIIGIGREVSGQRKDGTTFPMDLAVGEVQFPGKRLFTGIVRDISDRKHAEQEAHRRLRELAHVSRLQSIGEVASGLAHEINQPLTAIVSYAEACRFMLGRDEVDGELLRRSLADIVRQGERASEIINRLREFVHRGEVEHKLVDVNALVRGSLELLRHELALHDVQVQLALEEQLPPVRGSRVQIEQVLFNLARNAIDAMQTSPRRALEIQTEVMCGEKPMLAIGVSDTGEGLPSSSDERLFDAFFSTKPEGMGLGLSISRSIVEAHGGRIWARARDGGGTSFYFTLPLAEAGDR